jgi:hypothetical protein
MYEEDKIEPEFLKSPEKYPFRAPEGYFDTIEDRIMGKIKPEVRKQTTTYRIVRFMKPVIGIAASILLVYLLVKSPASVDTIQQTTNVASAESTSTDLLDFLPLNLGTVDDNILANAIFSDDSNVAKIDSAEVFAYLASDLNEVEIYSEIQN